MAKLNPNISLRHHSAHPPSAVRPNLDINQKPNFAPTEQASINVNPSLPGPVGVETNSGMKPIDFGDDSDDSDTDEADCEDGDCDDEDRLSPKHAS